MSVSDPVRAAIDQHREAFITAAPFKHVMIENFLDPAFAEQLLTEFPSFDTARSTNESGKQGGKSVNTDIRNISPAYQRLYDFLGSRDFLDFASRLSGIPDLLLDPKMFGGGTHENLHGQELDAHVDFNYDESRQLHRRLNLIVYLNHDWQPEWGGAIEIHSNPRIPETNQIRAFDPLFNRCVMFETNEYSWHGFPKIQLPEDKRHLSRKSLSIYLYTTTRPVEETAPLHATFYVQRPLPARFAEGHSLTDDDVHELKRLLVRRDQWIELYQNMELRKNAEIAESSAYVDLLTKRTRVPLTGYLLQQGDNSGLFGDEWASSHVKLRLQTLEPLTSLKLRAYRPPHAPPARLRVSINGTVAAETLATEYFELEIPAAHAASDTFDLQILCDSQAGWAAQSGDDRDLAYVMIELRGIHTTAARK
jgi:Rps23 Pro-64 3,4-dihydroxylase Tpa1-like proline 4-hydroxylase